MSELLIFEDSTCLSEVGEALYEGRTYYLRFPTRERVVVTASLAESGLTAFVNWHPLNEVATLRVVNRIGLTLLFGRQLDFRSEKLVEAPTGERQFSLILDDLKLLSRHLAFSSAAGLGSYRSHLSDSQRPSLLERFNYFRQTCLPVGKRPGLHRLVERVLRNPHGILAHEHVADHVWNARRPSRLTLRSLISNNQSFARLPPDHPLAFSRPGLTPPGSTDVLLPLRVQRARGTVTHDTAENRFVKHLLLDVDSVCAQAMRERLLSGVLALDCDRLQKLVRGLLCHDFFTDIGRLHEIPASSPSLTKRDGYRDLYRIYIRSRTGAKHLFEDFEEESLHMDLKDISLLYEYWVFYKVAEMVLSPGALIESRNAIVKDGRIVNGATVSDGSVRVHFNRSFSRGAGKSYSLSFRPDIVVESTGLKPARLHIIDAKYKHVDVSDSESDSDGVLEKTLLVKSADIHKMHCYVDAIDGTASAVAAYPGTHFVFYPRDRSQAVVQLPDQVSVLRGVGAVPLLPGKGYLHFDSFAEMLKKDLANASKV